jgi:hypothetical protein
MVLDSAIKLIVWSQMTLEQNYLLYSWCNEMVT